MSNFKKYCKNILKKSDTFYLKYYTEKINGVVLAENEEGIKVHSVKKDDKFTYKIYELDNGRLYTDSVSDTAIIKKKKIVKGPSFQFRATNSAVINVSPEENLAFLNGTPRLQKKIEGQVLSLLTGGAGKENYWHWMFDVLPRLVFLRM